MQFKTASGFIDIIAYAKSIYPLERIRYIC